MTHRALILASMGTRECRLEGGLRSADTNATREAIQRCGATVEDDGEALIVRPGERAAAEPITLDCANSGTTLRLMLGQRALAAGVTDFCGDPSLSRRPNGPLLDALRTLGARWDGSDARLPGRLEGPIQPGQLAVSGGVSSQYISSLLLALPQLSGDSRLRVVGPVVSKPYIHLTLAMAQSFGLHLETDECAEDLMIAIPGGQTTDLGRYRIEADWSTAAFPLVAAALTGKSCRLRGLSPDSKQGDRRIIEHLTRFGQELEWRGGALELAPRPLANPGAIDLSETPDLFPALAVLAALTPGETRFYGAAHLKFKESDRIERIVSGLLRIGIQAVGSEDGALIGYGQPSAGAVESAGDHRILMAFECLGLVASGQLKVNGRGHEQVSYPSFYQDLENFR